MKAWKNITERFGKRMALQSTDSSIGGNGPLISSLSLDACV